MQNWQKDRNYRKYENADGSFRYVVTVDGEDVEVGEAVYKVYSQADRRERYCAERDAEILLSLDRMNDDGVLLSYLTIRKVESAEDTAVRAILYRQAMAAIASLPSDEQALIHAVVIDGVTEQDYAEAIGVAQSTVHKRKKRSLKKIFEIMGINPADFREGK